MKAQARKTHPSVLQMTTLMDKILQGEYTYQIKNGYRLNLDPQVMQARIPLQD